MSRSPPRAGSVALTRKLDEFQNKVRDNLALDGAGDLTYIAPTRVNLALTMERWPDIEFRTTREH